MENDRKLDDRPEPGHSRRVLVAVHGREPAGWENEVCRALALSPHAAVRVLAITDVPSPPSASVLPAARRARARSLTLGRHLEPRLAAHALVREDHECACSGDLEAADRQLVHPAHACLRQAESLDDGAAA